MYTCFQRLSSLFSKKLHDDNALAFAFSNPAMITAAACRLAYVVWGCGSSANRWKAARRRWRDGQSDYGPQARRSPAATASVPMAR
jgi:hypothetical protein